MKITIFNLIIDTENGTKCQSFTSREQRAEKLAECLRRKIEGDQTLEAEQMRQILATNPEQALSFWQLEINCSEDWFVLAENDVDVPDPVKSASPLRSRSPSHPETRARLNDIAHAISERLPEGFGFFTLIFPFKGPGEPRANYVSNATREDVLNVMKEFLIRNGSAEDWMTDIK